MYLTKKEQQTNTCIAKKERQAPFLSKTSNLLLAIITCGVWFMIITIRQIIISQQAYQATNTIKNEH